MSQDQTGRIREIRTVLLHGHASEMKIGDKRQFPSGNTLVKMDCVQTGEFIITYAPKQAESPFPEKKYKWIWSADRWEPLDSKQ